MDVIISNIRLHNIRLQLGPYYEYREGQMTHKTDYNIITVDSEDKNPWKKNYVIKSMSQRRASCCCARRSEADLKDALLKKQGELKDGPFAYLWYKE